MTADSATSPSIHATGAITVISGCMFSGKTTRLLRRLEELSTHQLVAVKHAIDTRYSRTSIVSHSGTTYPANPVSTSRDIPSLVTPETTHVVIDEGHFFDDGLIDVIVRLASSGVSVIVTLLDRDSWGEPFMMAGRLGEIANEAVVLTALCGQCGGAADRTQRLTPVIEGSMVGGAESYEPRCKACWRPPSENSS